MVYAILPVLVKKIFFFSSKHRTKTKITFFSLSGHGSRSAIPLYDVQIRVLNINILYLKKIIFYKTVEIRRY